MGDCGPEHSTETQWRVSLNTSSTQCQDLRRRQQRKRHTFPGLLCCKAGILATSPRRRTVKFFPYYLRRGQVAQAARRLATGWTARVRSRVSAGWRFFVSRLVLGSTQSHIKAAERGTIHPTTSYVLVSWFCICGSLHPHPPVGPHGLKCGYLPLFTLFELPKQK